ncbi:IGR domain-containing protein [Ceratobasidium sp. AG-Ba]|nr:IGR domain-containing protein [Ceratobasidium sp. AG-Ba]QRW09135.1 IGR domain-containing protein [Ceratobasidium sp. AG-Ba]
MGKLTEGLGNAGCTTAIQSIQRVVPKESVRDYVIRHQELGARSILNLALVVAMNAFLSRHSSINAIKHVSNSVANRLLHGRAVAPPTPSPRGNYQTPKELLAAIGRSSDTKLKVEAWEDLWRMRGEDMKKAGLTPAERRYILWALEKFRQGQDPAAIAIKERPKKTIRGWGPRVQNGKRVR